jgi:hypothetical protein
VSICKRVENLLIIVEDKWRPVHSLLLFRPRDTLYARWSSPTFWFDLQGDVL